MSSTIGYGGTMEWSAGGGAFQSVAKFKSAGLPVDSVDKIERTHMASPNRTRESTPGMRDPQDVEFVFNYNSADYAALLALSVATTVATWRHTLAPEDGKINGSVYEYDGFITVGSGDVTFDGITEVTVTVHRTGRYTFTEATA